MHKLAPLTVVFVALLALTAYRESERPSATSLSAEMDLRPLAAKPFKAEEVTAITVAGPGKSAPDFSLVRQGEGVESTWLLDAPFRAPAAAGVVAGLIDAVTAAEGELRSEDQGMLGRFHLDAASRTTVLLKGAGGETLAHFALGRTSGQQGAFVRMLGGKDDVRAYAVTNDLRGTLGLPPTLVGEVEPGVPQAAHFQDKNFPPLQLGAAVKAELVTPRHRTVFQKQGRLWAAIEGGPGSGVQVKMDAITKVLGGLSGSLRPSALADPALKAELGFDAPAYRIEVTLEDGAKRGFAGARREVDGRETHYLALETTQDPDVLYELSAWDFGRLFPRGSDLFQLAGLDVNSATLGRVVVESGERRIELSRPRGGRNTDWELLEPRWPLLPQQSALRSLTSALESLAPVDWVHADTDPGEPELSVRFGAVGAPDPVLARLDIFGEAPGGGRLARLPGRQGTVVLDQNAVDRLLPESFALFTKRVLDGWDERLVHTLQVQRVEGGEAKPHFVLSVLGGAWKLSREGTAIDAVEDKAKEWIKRLVDLRVNEVTDEGAEPVYVLTLKRQLGESITLGLSEVKDGGRTLTLGDRRFSVDENDLLPAADTLLPEPEPAEPGDDAGNDEDSGAEEPEDDDSGE